MINFNKRNVNFIAFLTTCVICILINTIYEEGKLIIKKNDVNREISIQCINKGIESGIDNCLLNVKKVIKNESKNKIINKQQSNKK